MCNADLCSASPTLLASGLAVVSGFRHDGAARRLVHRLKYEGMVQAGVVLAEAMAPLVPSGTLALVPVPRAIWRRLRYGNDPAVTLARLVGSLCGVPVIAALQPRLWWPSHAGSTREARRSPGFRVVRPVPAASLLIDDVLTTGATLGAAAAMLPVSRALTATRAGRMSREGGWATDMSVPGQGPKGLPKLGRAVE